MEELIIGDQIWSAQNLNVDAFINGDKIFECKTEKDWKKAGKNSIPAFCSYNFNKENDSVYGKLYNWFAVNDQRSISMAGWTVPTEKDWFNLISFLGKQPGVKLKSKSAWIKDKCGYLDAGLDQYGFNALPGGTCEVDGKFEGLGTLGIWWSRTVCVKPNGQELKPFGMAFRTAIASANGNTDALVGFMDSKSLSDKREGLSVRLIKQSAI